MLKTLIIATVLLPTLTIAQQSPATTATETARPMVPAVLDGERQLLRTGSDKTPIAIAGSRESGGYCIR